MKKPMNYWSSENGKNMRILFEQFAESRNFDPLVPENWYDFSAESFVNIEVLFHG